LKDCLIDHDYFVFSLKFKPQAFHYLDQKSNSKNDQLVTVLLAL